MDERRRSGEVRDAIVDVLSGRKDAHVDEIAVAVEGKIGPVARSSVRSYLNLNTPERFERTGRGRYKLKTLRS